MTVSDFRGVVRRRRQLFRKRHHPPPLPRGATFPLLARLPGVHGAGAHRLFASVNDYHEKAASREKCPGALPAPSARCGLAAPHLNQILYFRIARHANAVQGEKSRLAGTNDNLFGIDQIYHAITSLRFGVAGTCSRPRRSRQRCTVTGLQETVKPVPAFGTPRTALRVYAACLNLVSTGAAEWDRNDPGAYPKHIPAHVLMPPFVVSFICRRYRYLRLRDLEMI